MRNISQLLYTEKYQEAMRLPLRLCALAVSLTLFASCSSTKNTTTSVSAFSKKETAYIAQADSSRPMRVFLTTNKSDSMLLRQQSKSVRVTPGDPELLHFVTRLYNTVRDSASMGVGIAAPQVGILRQIIWVQRFDKPGFPFEVFLNPVIKQYTKYKKPGTEGCLSIPDEQGTVERSYAILLEYDKMDGTHVIEMVEDFTAVIFQHEVDHLYGVLYTDKKEPEGEGD